MIPAYFDYVKLKVQGIAVNRLKERYSGALKSVDDIDATLGKSQARELRQDLRVQMDAFNELEEGIRKAKRTFKEKREITALVVPEVIDEDMHDETIRVLDDLFEFFVRRGV